MDGIPVAGPSQSYTPVKRSATTATASIASDEHQQLDQESTQPDGPPKKRRRPRQVLSCTECVRRKCKCDQIVPCGACVKRGDPASCVIETVAEPTDQPPGIFASSDELSALRERVFQLERMLPQGLLNVGLPLTAPTPTPAPPTTSRPTIRSSSGLFTPVFNIFPKRQDSGAVIFETEREQDVVGALSRLKGASQGFENGHHSQEKDELALVLDLLPRPATAELLLESFLTRVHWSVHVLHVPSLKREFRTLWTNDGLNQTLDLEWIIQRLPVILIVLALGLHFIPSTIAPFSDMDRPQILSKWLAATEKSLVLGDWTGKPRLRSVQAILLLCFYFQNQGELARFVTWMGAANRIAQLLGMNLASTAGSPIRYPNETFDIAPERLSFFLQELSNRVWWWVCVFDWDVSFRTRNMAVLLSHDFTTAAPLNLSDEDLEEGPIQPKPLVQPTISTYGILLSDLVFIHQQWSQPKRSLGVDKRRYNCRALPSKEALNGLDKIVREIGGRIPEYFQLPKASTSGTRAIDSMKPYIPLQRLSLAKEIYSKSTRIHRRTMLTVSDTESREACRSAASTLLDIIQEFRDRTDYASKLWWIEAYTLLGTAVLVVSNILIIQTTPKPMSEDRVADVDRVRSKAVTALDSLRSSSSTYGHEASRILDSLLAAEDRSRLKTPPTSFVATAVETFDRERFMEILTVISRATICNAKEEKDTLGELADELALVEALWVQEDGSDPPVSNQSTSGRDSAGQPPLDPTLAFGWAPSHLAQQTPYGTEVAQATTPIEGLLDEDDFFRSLGLLPPSTYGIGLGGFEPGSWAMPDGQNGASQLVENNSQTTWKGAFTGAPFAS